MDGSDDDRSPLTSVCNAWIRRITRATDAKKKQFTEWADEGMKFFLGEADVWKDCMTSGKGRTVDEDSETPNPKFKFVLAKTQELVQIIGPVLYNRNPTRTVTVRDWPELNRALIVDPLLEQQAQQMSQQLQQMQQQMQASMQPPQPGQPPAPPPDPNTMMQFQQLQQQVQELQGQLQQADERWKQIEASQKKRKLHAQTRADLLSAVLNYTPNEYGLKQSIRDGIDEALIKGMGTEWTVGKKTPGGTTVFTSEYDSVDNLMIDPDAESWDQVKWIARRCVHWVYDVAADYGISLEELRQKGTFESATSQADTEGETATAKDSGRIDKNKDMLVYWKIWSRVGVGQKLAGVPEEYKEALDGFGEDIYLVVAKGISEPLNFTADDVKELKKLKKKKPKGEQEDAETQARIDELFMKVQWPIPLHIDNRWPVVPIKYHNIPNCIWPMAHMRTSLPFLKFMNWQLSFLADHVAMTARLFVAHAKSLDDETKAAIKGGESVTMVEFAESGGETLDKMLQFMTAPQGGTTELLTAAGQINREFEKASGLNELSYAMPGGMRSAAEAQIKESARNIRPDDMADKTEEAATAMARNEALAWLWLADGSDVAPIIGEAAAQIWDELIASQDPIQVSMELDFRIEEGTAKKPNKDKEIADANQLMQSLSGVLVKLVDRGMPGPFNALMKHLGKVNNMGDISEYLVPPPPPPQPPQVDPTVKAKAEADLQKTQLDIELAKLKVQNESQVSQIKLQTKQQDLAFDQARASQEMQQDNMRFEQEQNQTVARMQMEQMKMQQQAMMPPQQEEGV